MQEIQGTGLIPGSGRSGEGGDGNPLQYSFLELLQYSCLEDSTDSSLVGYSPWDPKESDMTGNARSLDKIPTNSTNKWNLCFKMGFPCGSVVKNPPANAGDSGSILSLGRSLGEGNGNTLQYSCLGNPMDRGACGVTKSQTRLSWLNNNNTFSGNSAHSF